MAYSLRKQFGTSLASSLLTDIQYQKSNYYYFLGKIDPWTPTDVPPATVQPLSEYEDKQLRDNAVYFKKITPNDVTLVCPRYDWMSGITYTQWDHTQTMDGTNFYVLTDENHVYKCLSNNASVVSTVKPSGKPLQPFTTADGYIWKYMYSVPSFKKTRFTSVNYIPVQKALSDSFYNKGSVESVSVIQSGQNYTDGQQTFITVSGATTGSGASATFTLNPSGGIQTVTLVSGGTGYTAGVKVRMASTIGQDAILEATVTAGVITGVAVVNPGIGYQLTDSVSFIVGGAILLPAVSTNTGSITDVIIIDGGAGYSGTPTLTLTTTTPTSVDGLYTGNSSAILEAIVDQGRIQRVLIRDPGLNYPAATDTSITVQGDGTGLALTPVVYNGEIIDVIVEDSGVGYTNIVLTITGSGTGAALRPIFANSDYNSDQSVVEQVAVDGAIYAIKVTNGGTGYTTTTQVAIEGDGTGATAVATVVGNVITKITMTNWGSGYTRAWVTITDVNRNNSLGNFVNAVAYAILPPGNGHGIDAVNEMYGRTLAISSSIRTDPVLTQFNQDYRQFGIMHKPRNIISGKLSSVDTDFNVYECQFNNTTGLIVDEVLVFEDYYRFRVVLIEGTVAWLQPMQKTIIEPLGGLYAENDVLRVYTSDTILSRPVINKHTGSLMYISNEEPFEFSDTQGLLIKTYISF
jgi:hypothetical protein